MTRIPFQKYSGLIAPLAIDNIDTDQIIPSREMKTTNRTGLGEGLFAGWRYLSPGSRETNPEFILNRPSHENATIIVAGKNFGCGSSREHAVWALAEFGIRAVIAKSFGDIFYNNCTRNGLVPIILPGEAVDAMSQIDPALSATVDLPAQTVSCDGQAHPFEIGQYAKRLLMEGLDPIGLSMTNAGKIEAFQEQDRLTRPWIYEKRGIS